MLKNNDKKSIIAVVFVLLIIIGVLVFVRGCNQKDLKDDNTKPDPVITNPDKDENKQDDSSKTDNNDYKVVTVNDVASPKPSAPVLNLNDDYYAEVGDADFQLPTISETDEDGNPLVVTITYRFRATNEMDFYEVSGFSLQEIGIYEITYQVTNIHGQTTTKVITVEVLDSTNPVIEAFTKEYDSETGLTSYTPVLADSIINKEVKLVFSDNDKVAYAEYYKAIYEVIDGENTIEKESMMNVVDIDLTQDFYLHEDGEYHIRAYDYSGNYEEFVVTIDRTNPVISTDYQLLDDNTVLVTITSDEELKPVVGFILSEDQKILTKIYNTNEISEITIVDLAGNEIVLPIIIDQIITISVLQNDVITDNRTLNILDGDISVSVNEPEAEVTYTLDGGSSVNYIQGTLLTEIGDYSFTVTHGEIIETLDFSISSMLVDN